MNKRTKQIECLRRARKTIVLYAYVIDTHSERGEEIIVKRAILAQLKFRHGVHRYEQLYSRFLRTSHREEDAHSNSHPVKEMHAQIEVLKSIR